MKEIHKDIIDRRSIVAFSERVIVEEDLELLFEAAKWAPSSRNLQPWRFIYAHKSMKEEYNRLFSLLADSNKKWAFTAPVLALSIAETHSDANDRPNIYAFHDLGMAVGNLLVQATSMGIWIHQMGGYDREKARDVLEIPESFEPGAMIAMGYRGNLKDLPEELWKKELAERSRKGLNEFLFRGSWPEHLKRGKNN